MNFKFRLRLPRWLLWVLMPKTLRDLEKRAELFGRASISLGKPRRLVSASVEAVITPQKEPQADA